MGVCIPILMCIGRSLDPLSGKQLAEVLIERKGEPEGEDNEG